MPVTTYDKQQSKSATLPLSQLTKTLLLTSQCIRYLTDKQSSRNWSSGLKMKVPRHSQERESDALFASCGQSNAREIGNLQQGLPKQRKIQATVSATKSGSCKRRIMNRQQEDKLVNRHNDPDHNVDTVWYKGLWWAVKKQAKKIANSNADADSSSDESVSNKTRVTKRPSGSTRNKHGKKLVSDENFIFPSSEGLKIESWEKVSYRKMVHVPPIDVFQPKQNSTTHFKLPLFRITSEKTGEKPEEDFKLLAYNLLTTSSEKTGETLVEDSSSNLKEPAESKTTVKILKHNVLDQNADIELLADITTSSEKTGEKLVEDIELLADITTSSEKTGEKLVEDIELLADITISSEKTGEKLVEGIEVIRFTHEQILSPDYWCRRNEFFYYNQNSNGADVLYLWMLQNENQCGSCGLFYLNLESNGPDVLYQMVWIKNQLNNATLGSRFAYNDLNIHLCQQDLLGSIYFIINGYKQELTTMIKLYKNIIKNETCRVMKSIDIVVFNANHLLGNERTKILFDILNEKLLHFGSPGALSEFVPNMAKYSDRQNVILFFEHAYDVINIPMKLLLCCPDSESLQKMTEKEFTSLMLCVIGSSSLKTKSNKGAKPSLKVKKGTKWIPVDSEEFLRALGRNISEDVLDKFHNEDEMIVQKLDDTRHQPSDRRENRPIHSIYFPDDCRLFIYIPTEDGSYWHQLDMQRASRIYINKNNYCNLSSNFNKLYQREDSSG